MSTPPDPQSRAFREASPDDSWDDDIDALVAAGGAHHPPVTTAEQLARLRLPDDYEANQWDADRDGPKTPDEAREALAARIADPSAPDTGSEASVYDEGGN